MEKADKNLADVDKQLKNSQEEVARLAAVQYKGTGLDPAMEVVMSSSPEDMLDDAAVAGHVSRTNGERLLSLTELKKEREEASEKADAKLVEAKELVDDIEEQREEVLEKIERYEAEQIPETPGDGTVPASAKGGGFDGATPRMAAIRDEIIQEFGAPFPVGCVRPSADDHGTGQACDFMMSNDGGHPTSENQQLGQQIAEYAQANADRLGVKYVIWEQRIWDVRNPGAGWKQMEDRGSITQNHFDHVHVSSF
ncbi:coiled-coil domain-containing protein [Allosalinactinospora lopnorensis]|uniref:coiled-coil domain-containing protein n=1 Tax=Allosalinactinospora lopnorensis TaxID=1352348 RepID=UPI000AD3F84B